MQLLQGTVTPSRERELAASKPVNVVASNYMLLIQAELHRRQSSSSPRQRSMGVEQGARVSIGRAGAYRFRGNIISSRALRVSLLLLCRSGELSPENCTCVRNSKAAHRRLLGVSVEAHERCGVGSSESSSGRDVGE